MLRIEVVFKKLFLRSFSQFSAMVVGHASKRRVMGQAFGDLRPAACPGPRGPHQRGRPDDKLPEHRQNKEALNSVFCPFSLGNRSCLGKPLVYMELSIAIARLVWEFDVRLAESCMYVCVSM
jgi:hypothetical protein